MSSAPRNSTGAWIAASARSIVEAQRVLDRGFHAELEAHAKLPEALAFAPPPIPLRVSTAAVEQRVSVRSSRQHAFGLAVGLALRALRVGYEARDAESVQRSSMLRVEVTRTTVAG